MIEMSSIVNITVMKHSFVCTTKLIVRTRHSVQSAHSALPTISHLINLQIESCSQAMAEVIKN